MFSGYFINIFILSVSIQKREKEKISSQFVNMFLISFFQRSNNVSLEQVQTSALISIARKIINRVWGFPNLFHYREMGNETN